MDAPITEKKADSAADIFRKAEKHFICPPFNVEESRRLCQEAASMGHTGAKGLLSDFLYYGLGGPKDEVQAFKLAAEAAEAGNFWGQLIKATCLGNGHGGVGRDDKAALKLYEAAAAQDCGAAMLALGYYHELGIGVPRDLGKAKQWFQKAAERPEVVWQQSSKAAEAKLAAMGSK
mmetsp:Transcript_14221/g.38816  ORF Transcript_14221/g.38816 Transcript_14221/m.38816 type:complete len:176 (+) Transcript_14221:1-528(+)